MAELFHANSTGTVSSLSTVPTSNDSREMGAGWIPPQEMVSVLVSSLASWHGQKNSLAFIEAKLGLGNVTLRAAGRCLNRQLANFRSQMVNL